MMTEAALRRIQSRFEEEFPGTSGEVRAPGGAESPWILDVYGVPDDRLRVAHQRLAELIVDAEDDYPGLYAVAVPHSESATREHYGGIHRKLVMKRFMSRPTAQELSVWIRAVLMPSPPQIRAGASNATASHQDSLLRGLGHVAHGVVCEGRAHYPVRVVFAPPKNVSCVVSSPRVSRSDDQTLKAA